VCSAGKLLFLLLTLFSFLLPTFSNAETNLKIPVEYGEVIYQFNEKSPKQIFIIGISHRDSLTCLNGNNTSRVQAEVYKIGDWLIHNQGLELLLPEGFFKSISTKIEKKNINPQKRGNTCASLDMKILEEKLSDDKTYVNAEMLLKENHPLRLRQVEDKGLYDAVRNNLLKLGSCGNDLGHYSLLKSELDYLQERRTAVMLQKIPEMVEEEFGQGNIKCRKAIFTIGMSHLNKIIRYLNENRIKIYAPLFVSKGNEDYIAQLNLQKGNFGASVIIPKTLATDQKILEINKLDKIITDFRKRTSILSSVASQ
jgi:hypothetical protein